jgi:hypothetical protein
VAVLGLFLPRAPARGRAMLPVVSRVLRITLDGFVASGGARRRCPAHGSGRRTVPADRRRSPRTPLDSVRQAVTIATVRGRAPDRLEMLTDHLMGHGVLDVSGRAASRPRVLNSEITRPAKRPDLDMNGGRTQQGGGPGRRG